MKYKTGLTAERLREVLDYHPETGVFTWKYTPRGASVHKGDMAGVYAEGYIQIGVDGVKYRAHRLAFLWMTGKWPVADVDHRNGDRADNRFSNIREATKRQNIANSRPHNKLGIKGVRFNGGRKFQALFGQRVIGSFPTAAEAARAYQLAAKEAFGEYAYDPSRSRRHRERL